MTDSWDAIPWQPDKDMPEALNDEKLPDREDERPKQKRSTNITRRHLICNKRKNNNTIKGGEQLRMFG